MEPVTLATAAVAALAPYLAKAGESVAEAVGKQALAKGEAILQALWARWRNKPEAAQRLAKAVADHGAGREELVAAVAVEVATDPAFAQQLEGLVKDGPPEIIVRQDVGPHAQATGAEVRQMLSGKALIEQIVRESGSAVGFKADVIGRG